MKTPEDYSDEIAKTLYMGTVPDLWNVMAKGAIVRAMREHTKWLQDEVTRLEKEIERLKSAS